MQVLIYTMLLLSSALYGAEQKKSKAELECIEQEKKGIFPKKIEAKKDPRELVQQGGVDSSGCNFIQLEADEPFTASSFRELLNDNLQNFMPTIIARVVVDQAGLRFDYYDAVSENRHVYGDTKFKIGTPPINTQDVARRQIIFPIRYYIAYGNPDEVTDFDYLASSQDFTSAEGIYGTLLRSVMSDVIDYDKKQGLYGYITTDQQKAKFAAEFHFWIGDIFKQLNEWRLALKFYQYAADLMARFNVDRILIRIYLPTYFPGSDRYQQNEIDLAKVKQVISELQASLPPEEQKKKAEAPAVRPVVQEEEKKAKAGAIQWAAEDRATQELWNKIVQMVKQHAILTEDQWTRDALRKLDEYREDAKKINPNLGEFLPYFLDTYWNAWLESERARSGDQVKKFIDDMHDIAPGLFGSMVLTQAQLNTLNDKILALWLSIARPNFATILETALATKISQAEQPVRPSVQPPAQPEPRAPAKQPVGAPGQLRVPAPAERPALRPSRPSAAQPPAPQMSELERRFAERKKRQEEEKKAGMPPQAPVRLPEPVRRPEPKPAERPEEKKKKEEATVAGGWNAKDKQNQESWAATIALLKKHANKPTFYDWVKDAQGQADYERTTSLQAQATEPLKSFLQPFWYMWEKLAPAGARPNRATIVDELNKVAPQLFGSQSLSPAQKETIRKVIAEQFTEAALRNQALDAVAARIGK